MTMLSGTLGIVFGVSWSQPDLPLTQMPTNHVTSGELLPTCDQHCGQQST